MIKRTYLSHAVAAAFFLAAGAGNLAFAVDEVEPNNAFDTAQRLTIERSATEPYGKAEVSAAIGQVGDVDFYSFEATEGDPLIVDIDAGMKPLDPAGSVDTALVIYGPLPSTSMRRENLNMDPRLFPKPDDGSLHHGDAYINDFRPDKTGTYVVAVRATSATRFPKGTYKLVISGVTPQILVQHINIEIKPGSLGDAPANPKAKGNIPLALLSHRATDTKPAFDALKVKTESLTFGSTGEEKSFLRCSKEGVDVNNDGLMDLVCHFDNVKADWQLDDVEGKIKGLTVDDKQFEGAGRLKIVPKVRD